MDSKLHVTTRKAWRQWLRENHQQERQVWLVYYKKHTGKPRVPYNAAVEEALCFGWIDSIVKTIDDETYMQKFTPRKTKSTWSESNKRRVQKLLETGEMAEAGLRAIETAKSNGSWDRAITSARQFEMSAEFREALSVNKDAKDFFDSLSASCQRQYTGWIGSAKKPETRQKRVKESMVLLSKKQKLGMK